MRQAHSGNLTDDIVHALRGADYLGSLLRVSSAVEAALQNYEGELTKAVIAQVTCLQDLQNQNE